MMQRTLDEDRIIEMAWEDRTTFDSIKDQFGLNESEVIKIMRNNLKKNSFSLLARFLLKNRANIWQ